MKQTMKRIKINVASLFMLALALIIGTNANAQGYNVESMKIELEDNTKNDIDRDYTSLLKWAGEAKEHSKTANSEKMWYYRGVLYLKIASLNNDLSKANPNAIRIALESFKKAIAGDVKEKYTKLAQGNLLNVAIGLYQSGYAFYTAGDYASSYTDFADAVPLMQYDVDGELKRKNLTSEFLEQMMAYSAMNNNEDQKAIQVFAKLIQKESLEPSIYVNISKLYLKTGDTAKALEAVTVGRGLLDSDKSLINAELDLYLKMGRSKELIEKLDVAIADDPGNTIYYFARAISFEGIGDMDKASADYDKILEIDPTFYDAAYNKGVMFLNKVAKIVEQLNGEYKPSIIAKKEAEINILYDLAIIQFENVFQNNDEMKLGDKTELAGTMKKIYARLERMEKYNQMKAFEEANK
mgnify:FL=1